MVIVVDQFSDSRYEVLLELAQEHPDEVSRIKEANIEDPSQLPASAFAWPEAGLFPIHDPRQAVLSKLYAVKQASHVPEDVMRRIDTALELYGENVDIESEDIEKTASQNASDTRNYLLPSIEKLAFDQPAHAGPVAHALLSQSGQLTAATLAEAATNFVKTAAEMNLSADAIPARMWKLAGCTTCDAGVLLDWIEARAVCCVGEKRAMFDAIAEQVRQNFPSNGVIDDRNELVKLATALAEADQFAGIEYMHDRRIPNPLESVFNMDKLATQTVELAGRKFPLDQLLAVSPETYEEILGEDVMEHAKVGADVAPDQFASLLETLPLDLQRLLATQLEAYL